MAALPHLKGMDHALPRRRALAAASHEADADTRLERARRVARLLDDQFEIPGTSRRIGIDPILGLVPGIGDVLGAVLSSWLLVIAARLGAPGAVLARMGLNIAIDTLVGAVPLAGDVFDAGWKANTRNLRLLEGWLERPARTRRASVMLVVAIAVAAVVAVAAVLFVVWRTVSWSMRTIGA